VDVRLEEKKAKSLPEIRKDEQPHNGICTEKRKKKKEKRQVHNEFVFAQEGERHP